MKLFKHQSIIFTLATLCLFASSVSLNQAFAVDDNTDFNISVDPTLEITLPDSVNLLINPSVEGTIADTSFDITVGTNNLTGYTLTMYNDSSNLTSTDSSAIIPTLSNEIAKSNFPVNHWGYSLDDNTYKPITTATSGTVLKTTETTSAADTTTINLATKVDLDKPAGTYTNTFVFNVVANELPSYTITWNANGGTVSPTTSSIQYGNPIGTLPVPTYDGYNFLGWFTAADGGTEISSATIVTGTATYYAHWEEAIKMINFTVDGEPYQAEEGMIWKDWLVSEYNIDQKIMAMIDSAGSNKRGIGYSVSASRCEHGTFGDLNFYGFAFGNVAIINESLATTMDDLYQFSLTNVLSKAYTTSQYRYGFAPCE